jgi:hypothetical protein
VLAVHPEPVACLDLADGDDVVLSGSAHCSALNWSA